MSHIQVNTRGPETDMTQALKITRGVLVKKPTSVCYRGSLGCESHSGRHRTD